MGRLKVIALALLFITPGLAQDDPDPGIIGDTLRPVTETLVDLTIPQTENATGDDLHSEEFHIQADLNVTNIEYQIMGILFGGGKIQADLRGRLSIDFHAVSMERLDDAIRAAAGNDNVSMHDTFGVPSDRMALTAEEIRLIGAGALLAAFQTQQEGLATRYVIDLVPGLRILGLDVQWSNTQPVSDLTTIINDPPGYDPGIPSLRDPPLRLDVIVDLQYLDRLSAYDILRGVVNQNKTDDPVADELKKELLAEQELPFLQRTAFQVMGIGQLLNLELQPGWTLDVSLRVPKGFTVVGVTDELDRSDDRQTARYYLDGSERSEANSDAAVVTVSNRFLVTTVLLVSVLLLGVVLRASTEIGVLAQMRRRQRVEPKKK